MRFIRDDLIEWAEITAEEIDADQTAWWHPPHEIFVQTRMKFMNKNLNYTYLGNMVAIAMLENPEWHPGLQKTIDFCHMIREDQEKYDAPFGRMVIWKVLANKALLPHRDAFSYHHMITRYIFFATKHPEGSIIVKVNHKQVPSNQGVLWEFNPGRELHTFINNSDKDLLVLAFDVWDEDKLFKAASKFNLKKAVNDPRRYTEFGNETYGKYITQH